MIGLMKAMAFTGGDWVIYILILCSVLTLAVIVERSILLSKEKKEVEKVKSLFDRGMPSGNWREIGESLKPLQALPARVLADGIGQIPQGIYIVEETMAASQSLEKKRLENHMMILNTLGNNAVYIGLFGTVLGVIKAFRDLSLQGGGGAEVVMQGLSEALIATATGLLVAIPCVVAYNYLQREIRDVLTESENMSRLLLAKLKSEKK